MGGEFIFDFVSSWINDENIHDYWNCLKAIKNDFHCKDTDAKAVGEMTGFKYVFNSMDVVEETNIFAKFIGPNEVLTLPWDPRVSNPPGAPIFMFHSKYDLIANHEFFSFLLRVVDLLKSNICFFDVYIDWTTYGNFQIETIGDHHGFYLGDNLMKSNSYLCVGEDN